MRADKKKDLKVGNTEGSPRGAAGMVPVIMGILALLPIDFRRGEK
jgi:hypothetical protein